MNKSIHGFTDLFTQLGLPADEPAIGRFLRAHSPLATEIALADAPFWSPGQATFLREEIIKDADWAEVVDQLDAALRERPMTAHERRLSVMAPPK